VTSVHSVAAGRFILRVVLSLMSAMQWVFS